MSDTIDNALASNHIPSILAALTLQKMVGDIIFPKLATVDFSKEVSKEGKSVSIPGIGTFTAKDKVARTATSLQQMDSYDVQITLNKHKYVQYLVEDTAAAASRSSYLERLAQASASGLVEAMEQSYVDLFDNAYVKGIGTITVTASSTAVTGANTSFLTQLRAGDIIKTPGGQTLTVASVTSNTALVLESNAASTESAVTFTFLQRNVRANGSDVSDSVILGARKRLRSNKVNANGLTLVSNLDDFEAILSESTYKGADSVNASLIREGAAGRIRGFNVYEDNFFEKDYSVAFDPSAIGVAVRVLDKVEDAAKSGVIIDPKSGLAIRYIYKYDDNLLGNKVTMDILYGMNIIEPEKCLQLVEAAS